MIIEILVHIYNRYHLIPDPEFQLPDTLFYDT
jgi:hypothetical protein